MAKTSAQIVVSSHDGAIASSGTSLFRTYREMRKHPTIAIGRRYSIAPALLQKWQVVGDDPSLVDHVDAQVQQFRELIVRTAMSAFHDFGYYGYELTWVVEEMPSTLDKYTDTEDRGGPRRVLKAVKPLRVDNTLQLVDKNTGSRIGLLHRDQNLAKDVYLNTNDCLFINFDWEGTGDYGLPTSEVARLAYDAWLEADKGAKLYDEKAAGVFRVVKYPEGKTPFLKEGETEPVLTHNDEIADVLLKSLRSSGEARIPIKRRINAGAVEQETHEELWKLELLTAGGGVQPSFIARLKYLDALMLRAQGLPERSLTEGSFGTKAEAEAHADAAFLTIHLTHERIIEAVNRQIVDPMLKYNFDAPGACRIEIAPMSDDSKMLAMNAITTLAPLAASSQELDDIDFFALFERAGIPMSNSERTELTVDDVQQIASTS